MCGGGGRESSLLNFTFPPQADVLYFGEVIVPDAIHDQVWMLANLHFLLDPIFLGLSLGKHCCGQEGTDKEALQVGRKRG